MKKLGIILILFLTLLSVNLVLAQEVPPCSFYGTITVNGEMENFETSTVTVHMIVNGNEVLADFSPPVGTEIPLGNYAVKINNIGSEIIFKINGVDTGQNQICISKNSTELNLIATIENLQGSFDGDTQSNIQDLTLIFGELVQFKQGNNTLVTFAYDFDSGSLNLSAIEINKQDENATLGSIEISGISLSDGQTKTVYIDNLANEDYVCVLDQEGASVSEMTGDCSNGVPVICDGSIVNGYTCIDEGDVLKVTGLTHSIVEESPYVLPSTPTTTGGGGGGGGGGATITTCTEDWSCSAWSECLDGARTRICTDSNSCGTLQDRPAIVQICTAEEVTKGEVETPAPITGGIIGALGTGGTAVVAVILIIIVIGLLIIVSRKKK